LNRSAQEEQEAGKAGEKKTLTISSTKDKISLIRTQR